MIPIEDLRNFKSGSTLFRCGDPGDCAYLIERGEIEILGGAAHDTQCTVLARLGPGEVFGEMSLIDGLPRTAAARAATDCVLLPITRALIERKLAQTDPFTRLLLKLVLSRFRGSQGTPAPDVATPPASHQQTLRQVAAELTLASDLRHALERDQLEVHFQPIVHLADASVAGFEALVRWNRDDTGYLPPPAFIAVAEETGLILPLGRWVLARAAAALPRLQAALPAGTQPFMSVNVSPAQLYEEGEVSALLEVLMQSEAEPRQIKLEITETVMLKDPQRAAEALHALRAAGVQLAIDDFGTGYSSFSHLHRYPLDTLKIDRSFVADQGGDAHGEGAGLLRALLGICRELGLCCVAEGIETEAQWSQLRELDCPLGQGYLFARPQPEAPLIAWLERERVAAPAAAAAQTNTCA